MSHFLIKVIIISGILTGMVMIAGTYLGMNQSAKNYVPAVIEHPTLHLNN